MKTAKPLHPPFARMVMEAIQANDGHASLQACKKTMAAAYTLPHGWEKRLNATVKMMLHKHQLAHVAGHMGTLRLSKGMAEREEKRTKRMEAAKAKPAKKAAVKKAGPKAKAMKKAPKKAVMKKAAKKA